jgi:hypothetical protein
VLRSLPLRIAGIFCAQGLPMQMWNRRDHVSKQDSFLFTSKLVKLTMSIQGGKVLRTPRL